MDYGRTIFAMIGFSATFLLCIPNFKRWQSRHLTATKLRLVTQALEQAEERVLRFQERHDQMLSEVCSHYLTHKELEEALASARAAMNETLEFAMRLRELQMKLLTSFPAS